MNKAKESVDNNVGKAKYMLINALEELEEKGGTKRDIEQLEKIIIKLETWQNK